MKTKAVKKEILPENKELKEVVDVMKMVFNDLTEDATTSSMLLESNIQDSFSKLINDSLKDPLKTNFTALKAIESSIIAMIHDSITNYFSENKENIVSGFRLKETGNALHYTVILKDTSIRSKSILFDYLSVYEQTPYSSRFPVYFQDIPVSLSDEFMKEVSDNKFERIF